jgi:hypothetical protein
LLAYSDPFSLTAGPRRIDIVLNAATTHVYAVVGTRSSLSDSRAYTLWVEWAGDAVPVQRPQTVVLVFGGAAGVRIGYRTPIDVPAFDIGAINSQFAGRTQEAIDLLLDNVREDYAGLNVSFRRDNSEPNEGEGLTTIYFGTSDTRLLGLADNVDPYNSDASQRAIIYTDTFSLFNTLNPGFDSTVQVLANVASHEIGHLLGLRHVSAPDDLMDVTATARQMLLDQWFDTSPLHTSVLATGVQDGPILLSWSLGGSLQPAVSAKTVAVRKSIALTAADDFYIPRSLLADCGCVDCQAPSNNGQ